MGKTNRITAVVRSLNEAVGRYSAEDVVACGGRQVSSRIGAASPRMSLSEADRIVGITRACDRAVSRRADKRVIARGGREVSGQLAPPLLTVTLLQLAASTL